MARKEVDIGIVGNDGTGDSIREAFRKVNDNFRELYAVFGLGGAITLQDLSNVITEERELYALGVGSGSMAFTLTPKDGTSPITGTVTSTDNVTDRLTCASTINFNINDQIVFSGTVFGGVISGTTYYINTIPTNNTFTISQTQDGLGINRILTSDQSGFNVKPRVLVGGEGIIINAVSNPEQISISSSGGRLSADQTPTLEYPMNAGGNIIGNVGDPTDEKILEFNGIYGPNGTFITADQVAINKGYADRNYIRKTGGGGKGQIRTRTEPVNRNEYTLTIEEFASGNFRVSNHGFDSGINNSMYVYNTTGTEATGLKEIILTTDAEYIAGRTYKIVSLSNSTDFTTLGAARNQLNEIFIANSTPGVGTGQVKPVYYIRYVNANFLSLYYTTANNSKIIASGGTGTQTVIDAFFDQTLEGNWVSNEVLPRVSTVRRQGDVMTGPLTLADHPFPFEGIGTPNRPDDLQAATKYYVDNSSFASELNLYVSTTGSDAQTNTPPGKEGRSWAYAYASLAKACERAEYFMNRAEYETGPYRQLIAYDNGASLSVVTSFLPSTPGNLAVLKFSNDATNRVDQGTENNEDITPGKFIVGRLSGAKAFISKYYGDDGSGAGQDYMELLDVQGTFILGENLEFGDPVKNLHITINIESGIYEEDYPIRIPENTAIVGDEFRRVLVRPRDRISQSSWVDTWFFRNSIFDEMIVTSNGDVLDTELQGWYGYHYYKKPNLPLNPGPTYTNVGGYSAAANLISTNKLNIQNAVVFFINSQPSDNLDSVQEAKSRRDTGFIVDAITNDLISGGLQNIINLQEVFSQVTTLDADCKLGMNHIKDFINNSVIPGASYATERALVTNMVDKIMFGFDPNYNTPKNNKDMDVFLCSDSTIIRQITCQGHGGFMMVLAPDGQILTKSPYCQQSGSFSGSINKQAFRGGQYIDGFAGNLKPNVVQKLSDSLLVTGIPREPEIPSSFFLEGERFKVNSWLPEPNAKVNAGAVMQANKRFVEAQTLAYLVQEAETANIKFNLAEFEKYIDDTITALIFDTTNLGNAKTSIAGRKFYRLDNLTLRIPPNQKSLLLGVLDYIKNTYITVIQNSLSSLVVENQSIFDQKILTGINPEVGSNVIISDLMTNLYTIVNTGIQNADSLDHPRFILKIDQNPLFASINPSSITLITPGNTSMLSNDYTQVNDLGYGIVTNNKGLAECVSVFSYYCWASMFSCNGGQIRSLNSSSANGEYGLIALGADPLEIPDQVYLADNLIQVAKVVRTGDYVNNNLQGTLEIYVRDFQFAPYNVSIVEVNHGAQIGIVRYEMSNVTVAETDANGNPLILKLNLNTSGNNESSTSGLQADLVNNQNVIIRSGQNLRFHYVLETNPIRPSTALTLEGDPDLARAPVYRVIAYGVTNPLSQSLNPAIVNVGSYSSASLAIIAAKTNIENAVVTYVNTLLTTPLSAADVIKSKRDTGYIVDALAQDLIDGDSDNIDTLILSFGNTALSLNCRKGILYISNYINSTVISAEPTAVKQAVTDLVTKVFTGKQAILTTDTTYNYIILTVKPDKIVIPDTSDPLFPSRTLGSQAGDIKIAITLKQAVTEIDRLNTGQMITAWDGKMHRIVSYENSLDLTYGIVTLANFENTNINSSPVADGIQSPLISTVIGGVITLRCGLPAGESANIRVRISTLRATGHDFLDIGTGGYNSSNYPSKIFGAPRTPNQANEVVEKTSGRVFYVSTDQNGFFRVGRFFTVDQGTGTVKFAASIALSNLDGLGFKRGVEISEFSDDDKFTDLAGDAVPTEAATDGYISNRLGLRRDGSVIPQAQRIGPGYLALNGSLTPVTNISFGGFRIISLGNPTNSTDAANKNYVDNLVAKFDSVFKQTDVIATTAEKGDVLVSFGTVLGSEIIKGFVTATPTGDIDNVFTSAAISTLTAPIASTGSILTINLADATNFPTSGHVLIDQEVFYYGNKVSNNLELIVRLSETDSIIDSKFNNGITSSHNLNAQVISLDLAEMNSQIKADTIVNADVKSDAGILQSKLSMRKADTFPETDAVNGWNKVNKSQEDLGLSKFSDIQFETNFGFVRVKDQGITLSKIQPISSNKLLGNFDKALTKSPEEIAFSSAFQRGLYDSIRDQLSNNSKVYAWTMANLSTEALSTQAPVEVTPNAVANSIVQRNGDGRTQLDGLETDGGVVIISAIGSLDNATPVVYKGQWSPGNDATFRATTADKVASSLTFNMDGSGASTGTTFDGSSAKTISYNTIGAPKADGTGASGTWSINVNGNITTTQISTGAATTAGTITGAWTLTTGSTLQATYADLAEYYTSDTTYLPGTVLIFGGSAETTTTDIFGDTRLAGVVTTNPAYVMNTGLATTPKVCIALQGRVPCKVIGKVRKGDLLTTAGTPGFAIRTTNPLVGAIVGKALQNKDTLEAGIIEVSVGRT
jgi:hypothetical protein